MVWGLLPKNREHVLALKYDYNSYRSSKHVLQKSKYSEYFWHGASFHALKLTTGKQRTVDNSGSEHTTGDEHGDVSGTGGLVQVDARHF